MVNHPPRLSSWLPLLVLGLGSAGCGAQVDVGTSSSNTGSNTGSDTGGATSGSSTAGAGGAGGTGVGGDGGAGIGGTGGVPSPGCSSYVLELVGGFDGQPIHVKSDLHLGFAASTPGTSYIMSFSDRSYLRVPAPDGYGSGTFPTKRVMLSMPPEGPSPGLWLCDPSSEDVAINASDDSLSLSISIGLHDLRSLGICPGTPVDGALVYCDPAVEFCGKILSGELAGTPLAPELDVAVSKIGDPEHLVGFQDGGMLAIEFSAGMTGGTGVVVTPSTAADPAAVYCIGKVSPGSDAAHFELTDISRLGSCDDGKPINSALSVCAGW